MRGKHHDIKSVIWPDTCHRSWSEQLQHLKSSVLCIDRWMDGQTHPSALRRLKMTADTAVLYQCFAFYWFMRHTSLELNFLSTFATYAVNKNMPGEKIITKSENIKTDGDSQNSTSLLIYLYFVKKTKKKGWRPKRPVGFTKLQWGFNLHSSVEAVLAKLIRDPLIARFDGYFLTWNSLSSWWPSHSSGYFLTLCSHPLPISRWQTLRWPHDLHSCVIPSAWDWWLASNQQETQVWRGVCDLCVCDYITSCQEILSLLLDILGALHDKKLRAASRVWRWF